MTEVGLFTAKTNLSQLISRVEKGETIVITRHGRPVAKLLSVQPTRTFDQKQRAKTIASIKRIRRIKLPSGETISALIKAGRKY